MRSAVFLLVLAAVTLVSSGCQKPQKEEGFSPPEQIVKQPKEVVGEPSIEGAEQAVTQSEPEPQPKPKMKKLSEAEKRLPSLVVTEDEATKTIRFTGEMGSKHQFDRLIKSLGYSMDGYTFENEVSFSDAIRVTSWGSRVDSLWAVFFTDVDAGVWSYEEGVTTMVGAASGRAVNVIQRITSEVMSGADAKAIDNRLVSMDN